MTKINDFRSIKANRFLSIGIEANSPDNDLDEPLWALNWFNLKSKRVYDLYNALAIRELVKNKVAPFYKGHFKRVLAGNYELKREMLLIVRYPSASSALNMLSALRFQIIHPLRNASVKDFCFSFLKNLGEDPKCADVEIMAKHLPDTSKHYLVHVFKDKTEQANRLVESIREFAGDDLIEFSGVMQARAGAYVNGSRFRPFPILADGVIVYAFDSEKQMNDFAENPELLSLCEKSYDFMLAEFDRQI